MADNSGDSADESGLISCEDSRRSARHRRPSQSNALSSMADSGFPNSNSPVNRRRNAVPEVAPPSFHRGTTTDTIPMSPEEIEEGLRGHDLVNLLPAIAVATAQEISKTASSAIMLAATRTIRGLLAKAQDDEEEKRRLQMENMELRKELDDLMKNL